MIARQQLKFCLGMLIALLLLQNAGNYLICSASTSAQQSMKRVAEDYNTRKYSQALAILSSLKPSAETHYYAGLCYQGLNQIEKAKQEFAWVYYYSTNANLKNNSQIALSTLERYANTRTYSGQGNHFAKVSSSGRSGGT